MRRYHLRRRLIATVLLLECALVAGMSTLMLLYIRHEQLRAFDLMLRGRADSLLGAVRDAEDATDSVMISPEALDLHQGDLWTVRDASGHAIARSSNWSSAAEGAFGSKEKAHNFRSGERGYRGLVLHGVRQIDADDANPGISRPVTILYAASLHPVHESIEGATRFLLFAGALLLLVTAAALTLLLRRGLAPLENLSLAAARITPKEPRFYAPESARATSELAVLAGALESATQRLQEAFQQQQLFVHDAAHELKTAVTIIKSSLQLLASRPRTTREYAEGLETCLGDCARMEELVQRMLQLARFEREPANTQTRCDLAEIAHGVVAQMETFAAIRKVRIDLVSPDSLSVPLSEDACVSLLSNLVMNAIQHTPEGGRAKVSLATGKEILLEVSDTGRGIAPEDLPHLFERFWRGDRSRARSTGGAGLGLAICKAIVDSCGGEIEIASSPGNGTRVAVRLPFAPQPPLLSTRSAAGEAGVRG